MSAPGASSFLPYSWPSSFSVHPRDFLPCRRLLMAYKDAADSLGQLASLQLTPLLVLHGFLSLCLLLRELTHFSDLRHWVYPRGGAAVWVCLLPAYHYCTDLLHLGAYLGVQFTSVAYYVHHVFGVHMILCGFQGKLANFSTLQMQASHGLLIASFQACAGLQVVACRHYYLSGWFMVLHHTVGVCVHKEWRGAGIGLIYSAILMAFLPNQAEIFAVCSNSPHSSWQLSALQVSLGALLASFSFLWPLGRTLRLVLSNH